jgi:hypothetical protein
LITTSDKQIRADTKTIKGASHHARTALG